MSNNNYKIDEKIENFFQVSHGPFSLSQRTAKTKKRRFLFLLQRIGRSGQLNASLLTSSWPSSPKPKSSTVSSSSLITSKLQSLSLTLSTHTTRNNATVTKPRHFSNALPIVLVQKYVCVELCWKRGRRQQTN